MTDKCPNCNFQTPVVSEFNSLIECIYCGVSFPACVTCGNETADCGKCFNAKLHIPELLI